MFAKTVGRETSVTRKTTAGMPSATTDNAMNPTVNAYVLMVGLAISVMKKTNVGMPSATTAGAMDPTVNVHVMMVGQAIIVWKKTFALARCASRDTAIQMMARANVHRGGLDNYATHQWSSTAALEVVEERAALANAGAIVCARDMETVVRTSETYVPTSEADE